MKKCLAKRIASFFMGCVMALTPISFSNMNTPLMMVAEAATGAALVNTTTLNVRSDAGTGFSAVGKLSMGSTVNVLGEKTGTDGNIWYQISYSSGGNTVTGYVLSSYIKFPGTGSISDGNFESYMASQGFPESYKPALRELHAQYPNWTFTSLQTGLDWNTAVNEESVVGRNLTGRENISSWKSTEAGAYNWDTSSWPGFDGSAWVAASRDIIEYYMDPRNFLNDKYIFQFMNQKYNPQTHTREGLASMVSGTFLAGTIPGSVAQVSTSVSTVNNSTSNTNTSNTNTSNSNTSNANPANPSASNGSSSPSATTETLPASGTANVSPVDAEAVNNGQIVVAPLGPVASVSSNRVKVVMEPGPGSESGPGSGAGPVSVADSNQAASAVSGGVSYIDVIMNAAAQSDVNPYILASMIIQEQGSQGTGNSISGRVSGYQGYYNFFNVEAYQSGNMGAVERGLWWCSQAGSYGRPWNSREKSILGGSMFYGENYLKMGQTTLYLKKFNVQGSNLYKHQYMTNVLAAAAEGLALAKITSLKSASLDFLIPVFKNMPETPRIKPTGDGCPNNKLKSIAVEGFSITPSFDKDTTSYDLIVDAGVASVNVNASALNSTASIAGIGTIDLASGINAITINVKAQNGDVRTYTLNVVRQTGGPVYNSAISGSVPMGGSNSGSSGSASGPATGPGMSTNVSIGPVSPVDSDNESVSGFGNAVPPNTQITVNKPAVQPGTIAPENAGTVIDEVNKENQSANTENVAVSGVKGDTNGDGKLNIMDVLNVQRHILGLALIENKYSGLADVNGNGKIDIMDVLLMQKDILGIAKIV